MSTWFFVAATLMLPTLSFNMYFAFSEISPYLDLALCPIRAEPWGCARQKSARILDGWDDELHLQWQKLKGERRANRPGERGVN